MLFPEYRRRVLGLLLLRPEEALHGREVARRTGLPAGTITRELTKLAEAGLLRREKRGNQQVYSANTSGPIFTELASILRKTSGLGDVLSAALAPLAGRVKLAFVFGSVARGEEALPQEDARHHPVRLGSRGETQVPDGAGGAWNSAAAP